MYQAEKNALDIMAAYSGVKSARPSYLIAARAAAKFALAEANRSGDPKRRAAAMRAINHFSREAYKAGV